MNNNLIYDYGFWSLVLFNIGFFLLFVLGFVKPMKKVEWKSMGVFVAFIVALFTEMFGFPLTIYFLTGILGNRYPSLNPFSHRSGHLWLVFLGIENSDTAFMLIHLLSVGLIVGGLILIALGWKKIHKANGRLVTNGIYSWVRHPQYLGIFLLTIGFLIQWPTLVTLAMCPILIFAYYKLVKKEEKYLKQNFGYIYAEYQKKVPPFIPRLFPR